MDFDDTYELIERKLMFMASKYPGLDEVRLLYIILLDID